MSGQARAGRAGKRDWACGGARHEAATRPLGPATRQPELRYGRAARPRYDAGLATTRTRARAPGGLAGPVGGSCSQFGF